MSAEDIVVLLLQGLQNCETKLKIKGKQIRYR